jgi:hypothetical protein
MVLLQKGLETAEKAISSDLHYIIMPGFLNGKEELGFGRRFEKSLPHGKWDDLVPRPMNYEDGCSNPLNLGERGWLARHLQRAVRKVLVGENHPGNAAGSR